MTNPFAAVREYAYVRSQRRRSRRDPLYCVAGDRREWVRWRRHVAEHGFKLGKIC